MTPLHVPPSIDVVYDEIRAAMERVLAERDALNTRASFILGAGSILTSAVTTVTGAVSALAPPQRTIAHVGIVIDVVLYLVVVLFAGLAYGENDFTGLNPLGLTKYLRESADETKRQLIENRLVDYHNDRRTLARKTGYTAIALRALVAEVVWLGVVLIVVTLIAA